MTWAYIIGRLHHPSIVRHPSFVCLHFQTFSSAKPLGQLKPNLMWVGGLQVCLACVGHKTKIATMPIYGKSLLKIFSRTKGPMIMGLGMQHWGRGPKKICSNNDLRLTAFFYGKVKFDYDFIWENMHISSGKIWKSNLMEKNLQQMSIVIKIWKIFF